MYRILLVWEGGWGGVGQDGLMFRDQTLVWTVQVRALRGLFVLWSWARHSHSASGHPGVLRVTSELFE